MYGFVQVFVKIRDCVVRFNNITTNWNVKISLRSNVPPCDFYFLFLFPHTGLPIVCVCVCVNLTQCYGNAKKQKQTNNIIRLVLISFVIVRCVRTMRPTGTPEISCRLVSTRFIINTVVRPPQCLERYCNVIPLYKKKKERKLWIFTTRNQTEFIFNWVLNETRRISLFDIKINFHKILTINGPMTRS